MQQKSGCSCEKAGRLLGGLALLDWDEATAEQWGAVQASQVVGHTPEGSLDHPSASFSSLSLPLSCFFSVK